MENAPQQKKGAAEKQLGCQLLVGGVGGGQGAPIRRKWGRGASGCPASQEGTGGPWTSPDALRMPKASRERKGLKGEGENATLPKGKVRGQS